MHITPRLHTGHDVAGVLIDCHHVSSCDLYYTDGGIDTSIYPALPTRIPPIDLYNIVKGNDLHITREDCNLFGRITSLTCGIARLASNIRRNVGDIT